MKNFKEVNKGRGANFKDALRVDFYDAGVSVESVDMVNFDYGFFEYKPNDEQIEIVKTQTVRFIDSADNTMIENIMALVEGPQILHVKLFNNLYVHNENRREREVVEITYNGRFMVWWLTNAHRENIKEA